ncbi:M56 family metallopeptidase [Flavobacterium cerinum]|uniref:Peptidase M56 domain-containing protein n=1 Tax=Flavobacterium cerinum TaxID=2502784 RepID=A0A3S3QCB4_9FLAO|nr:M56 family metallopeptidase [Flavobacterium cerinum]RWW98808.1 hypothetical protein EPI11_12840 [Flavobacterium cerinum]
MESFFIYLAKASGLIALFFLAYYLFIKKETFFTSNRLFLLTGLFTSVLLPFLVYTKIVWIDPLPPINTIIINGPILQSKPVLQEPSFEFNWMYIAIGVYLAGVLFFMIRFLIDLFKVVRLLKGKEVQYENKFFLIDSEAIQSPFSFFRHIVYNSALLQPNELKNIIAHEKVHSRQLHSVDMLLSQLFCSIFWFNPFVWLYKKAISQNLEFIADAEATKEISDVQAYQKTLLKITLQPECLSLTNHFYQSLIKKRIMMLNKQQSKKRNYWKYITIVPVLVAFIYLFQTEVIAQEKAEKAATGKAKNTTKFKIALEVNKDSDEKELNEEKLIFKQEFDADIYFSNIIRNAKGEIIAIKVSVKDKDNQASYPVYEVTKNKNDNSPIHPFTVAIEQEEGTNKNVITFNDPVKRQVLNHKGEEIKVDGSAKKDDSLKENWTVNSFTKNGKESLIIINGVKQNPGSAISIPLQCEVDKVKALNSKEAVEKYGEAAKHGAMEITLKEDKNATPKNYEVRQKMAFNSNQVSPELHVTTEANRKLNTPITERVQQINNSSTRIAIVKNESNDIIKTLQDQGFDFDKAYLSVDSKEVTKKELGTVLGNVMSIKNIELGKAPNEKGVEKYGSKAYYGFLVITTQNKP